MGKRSYSCEEREAALVSLMTNAGNIYRTAAQLGIPEATLRHWSAGTRHPEASKMADEKKRDMALALEEVAWKLLDAIPGKIDDAPLNQTATSFGIAVDKMRLLRDQPTTITKTDATLTARIAAETVRLMSSFEGAADREEGGALPYDGAGELLDTGDGSAGDDPEAG